MSRPIFCLLLLAVAAGAETSRELDRDDFGGDLRQWAVEQMPGGTVTVRNGTLVIEDAAGCTVWFREKLTAPIEINYEVTAVSAGGPHDRVSDVNCFWMANDPRPPAGPPFAAGPCALRKILRLRFAPHLLRRLRRQHEFDHPFSPLQRHRRPPAAARARPRRQKISARSESPLPHPPRRPRRPRGILARCRKNLFLPRSRAARQRVVRVSHRQQPPRDPQFSRRAAGIVTPSRGSMSSMRPTERTAKAERPIAAASAADVDEVHEAVAGGATQMLTSGFAPPSRPTTPRPTQPAESRRSATHETRSGRVLVKKFAAHQRPVPRGQTRRQRQKRSNERQHPDA